LFYSWYLSNIQCCKKNDECGESLKAFREVHYCGMKIKENAKQEEDAPIPLSSAAPADEESNNGADANPKTFSISDLPCCCACQMLHSTFRIKNIVN
jgi:hypothetical protein